MTTASDTPTIVLVHGGFADASYWAPVIAELQSRGLPVVAPANPQRGLAADAEYVASFVNQIDGPVLLVGHSYGGAVITVAGAAIDNAVGLVYVAAFILDEGESAGDIFGGFTPTRRWPRRCARASYPLPGGGTAVELSIAPEHYRDAFAADVASDLTDVLAVSQRPFAAATSRRPRRRRRGSGSRPGRSWPRPTTRSTRTRSAHMTARAGARTVEVDASHSIALSQPKAVADLIQTAVDATAARQRLIDGHGHGRTPPPDAAAAVRDDRTAAPRPSGRTGAPDIRCWTGFADAGGALAGAGRAGDRQVRACSPRRRAAARSRGIAVLTATGVQTEAHLAFSGLHQLLRPVRDRAAGLAASQREALDAAFGVTTGPVPELFRIAMAVLDLLSDVASETRC